MTDRYFALTVLLDKDIREDDAQPLINAIRTLKGVLKVEPHISNIEVHIAEERARMRLRKELWEVLHLD